MDGELRLKANRRYSKRGDSCGRFGDGKGSGGFQNPGFQKRRPHVPGLAVVGAGRRRVWIAGSLLALAFLLLEPIRPVSAGPTAALKHGSETSSRAGGSPGPAPEGETEWDEEPGSGEATSRPAAAAGIPASRPAGEGKNAKPETRPTAPSLEKARKALKKEEYDKALDILKEIEKMGRHRSRVHFIRGNVYFKTGLLELSWREVYLARVYQPANRGYANTLRRLERRLARKARKAREAPPEPIQDSPSQPASEYSRFVPEPAEGMTDEELELLRRRAERAARTGRPRLAVGLIQRILANRPKEREIAMMGVDVALRAGSIKMAHLLFEGISAKQSPELEPLRSRLSELAPRAVPPDSHVEATSVSPLVSPFASPTPAGIAPGTAPSRDERSSSLGELGAVRQALDELFLRVAFDRLQELRKKEPHNPEILRLMASCYALWGFDALARTHLREASFYDETLLPLLEDLSTLESSPLERRHSTLLTAPPEISGAEPVSPEERE